MNRPLTGSLIFLTTVCMYLHAQPVDSVRLMFYNVENLFDTFDDPAVNDNEFLPSGKKHWTPDHYQSKIANLTKAIAAAGEWNMPAIIGLCEIENRKVLNDLFLYSALSRYNYRIVHFDSPDPRGIDVAMAYLPSRFKLLKAFPVPVPLPDQETTRDILYCKGVLMHTDTIHLLINHWPSRRGGATSIKKRKKAALVARHLVDSIFFAQTGTKIILMGDFNDEPEDESLKNVLQAKTSRDIPCDTSLYILSAGYLRKNNYGSIKYRGHWAVFDHIIVSGSLLRAGHGYCTRPSLFRIFHYPFLLLPDRSHTGFTPFPSFQGLRWLNGFSDHLPVGLDLFSPCHVLSLP